MHETIELAAAAARTEAAGTAEVISGPRRGGPGGKAVSYSHTGRADFAQKITLVRRTSLPGPARRAVAGLLRPVSATAAAILVPPPRIELFHGGRTYRQVDGGEHWAGPGDAAHPRAPLDPLWLFDELAYAKPLATAVGTARVGGANTVHYATRIDPSDILDDPGVTPPLEMPAVLVGLAVEAWIDDDGRIRRMSHSRVIPRGRGEAPTRWLTTTLDRFGAPEPLAPPVATDVVAVSDVKRWF